jgi:hypothetical protein
VVGCTGGERRDEVIPTGAAQWREEALALPAHTPLVVEVRANALLAGLDALHGWLVADPAMFGPEGEELTRALVGLRGAMKEVVGGDVLLGATWSDYGLDVSRPWALGMWPIHPEALARLEQAEAALAARLGVKPGPNQVAELDKRLDEVRQQAQAPVGLYAEAARLVTQMVVVPGVRVALPISNEARLLNAADRLMGRLDMKIEASGPALPAAVRRVYHGAGGGFFVVRVQGKLALVDIIWSDDNAMTPAKAASQAVQAGRPAAPRAPGEPALALSLDQRGVGQLLRWWLYREALDTAGAAPAAERDAAFLAAWADGVAGYHQWETGGANVTGSSYALHVGSAQEPVARVQLALFGAAGLALPAAQAGLPTLGERAIGASMERALMLGAGSGWQRWLKLDAPSRLTDIFNLDDVTTLGGVAFVLALPRNMAMLLSNAVALIEAEFASVRLLPIYTQHERFVRGEVAAWGDDLSGFMAQPKLVGLIVLEPSLKPLERDAATGALRATVESAAASLARGDEEASLPSTKPLVADQLGSFGGGPLVAPLRYYYMREGAVSWVLWGYNLDDEAMVAEVERVKANAAAAQRVPRSQPALSVRVEPVALLRAASTYTPKQFTWIDVNILTQRLGTFVLRVRVGDDAKTPSLLYEAELERPVR